VLIAVVPKFHIDKSLAKINAKDEQLGSIMKISKQEKMFK